MQKTKLNQSHKRPNIPQFTPIRTDRPHKQGESLLTYIKNNIGFSQLNTSNTFPIEIRTNRQNPPFNITAITYRKHIHATQTLHPTITNRRRLNYIEHAYNINQSFKRNHHSITADVNAYSPLWYSPTKNHRGELIEDIC